jgi:phosphate transport system permease protein
MPQTSSAAAPVRRARLAARLRAGDLVAHIILLAFGLAVLGIAGLLAWELFRTSELPRHQFGWHFLVDRVWDPAGGQFGAAAFVYGTVVTSAIALLIAVPLGIGVAIFLSELAPPRLSDGVALLLELLAAIPSVIYGVIGIAVLVPLMRTVVEPWLRTLTGSFVLFSGPAYGVGYLTAGLILAIMVTPFIVAVGREVILAVPHDQREAALALGSTKWESTWKAVLPYARPGLYGAIFLALGRALGETMAVTMVIGNRPEIAASLFAPGYTMAAVIANEFTEAADNLYLESLIEVGLVLFVLTMVINAAARVLIYSTTHAGGAQ